MTEVIVDGWPPEGIDPQKQQPDLVHGPARTNAELWHEARLNAVMIDPPPTSELGTIAKVHDAGYIVETYDDDGVLVDTDYSHVGPNVWVDIHQHYPWLLL